METVWYFFKFRLGLLTVWVEASSESQALFVIKKQMNLTYTPQPLVMSSTRPKRVSGVRIIPAGAKAKKKASNTKKVPKPKVKQGLYNFPRPETLYRCNCGRDVPAGTCHLSKDFPLEFLVPSIPEDQLMLVFLFFLFKIPHLAVRDSYLLFICYISSLCWSNSELGRIYFSFQII